MRIRRRQPSPVKGPFSHSTPLDRVCKIRRLIVHIVSARRRYATLIKGSQCTSEAFSGVLKKHGIETSMDGKGRWVNNVFVERLWRSVKHEDVYLHAYETPTALRAGLERYFKFYNIRRRHRTLDRCTPDEVYNHQAEHRLAA